MGEWIRDFSSLQFGSHGDAVMNRLKSLSDHLVRAAPSPVRTQVRALLVEASSSYARALGGECELATDLAARVRAAGAMWVAGGRSLDDMVGRFGELTTCLVNEIANRTGDLKVDVGPVIYAGNALVREFLLGANEFSGRADLEGFPSSVAAELVERLIRGAAIPRKVELRLAPAYSVLVVRKSSPDAELFGADRPPGTLFMPTATGAVVLVPEVDERRTSSLVDQVREDLDGRAWCTVARRARRVIQSGYQEAVDVLSLVLASRRDCGVYDLGDVLAEYAAVQDEMVSRKMLDIVNALMSSAVLRETLDVLIRVDRHRNRAARELFIHRSTLDYRLRRIAEITGYDPLDGHDVQVLSVALTLRRLVEPGGDVPFSAMEDRVDGERVGEQAQTHRTVR